MGFPALTFFPFYSLEILTLALKFMMEDLQVFLLEKKQFFPPILLSSNVLFPKNNLHLKLNCFRFIRRVSL